jgi:hypothetical protein
MMAKLQFHFAAGVSFALVATVVQAQSEVSVRGGKEGSGGAEELARKLANPGPR